MSAIELPPKPGKDVPRWAKEKYDGMEKDISEYLYAVQFWRVWDGKEDTLVDASSKARALAEARFSSLSHSFDLSDAMERSKLWQLYQFKKNGWHHILPGEYDTLREVLLTIRDHVTSRDQLYQWDYLINEFLPAVERVGLPAELFTGIPDNFNKAVEAVPSLRKAINSEDIEMAKSIVERVVDDKETVRSMREWLQTHRPRALATIKMEVYLLPEDEELVVFRLPSKAHKQHLEVALRNIVEGEEVHAAVILYEELRQKLAGKRGQE